MIGLPPVKERLTVVTAAIQPKPVIICCLTTTLSCALVYLERRYAYRPCPRFDGASIPVFKLETLPAKGPMRGGAGSKLRRASTG